MVSAEALLILRAKGQVMLSACRALLSIIAVMIIIEKAGPLKHWPSLFSPPFSSMDCTAIVIMEI